MTKAEHEKLIEVAIARAYADGYKKGYDNGYEDGKEREVPCNVQMYTEYIGTGEYMRVNGYRFGEPWRAMQLSMEGGFETEDEAYVRWYKEKSGEL